LQASRLSTRSAVSEASEELAQPIRLQRGREGASAATHLAVLWTSIVAAIDDVTERAMVTSSELWSLFDLSRSAISRESAHVRSCGAATGARFGKR